MTIVVVGTGAAGVSVTFPIVEKGHRVILIDADGGEPDPILPTRPYLDERTALADNWPRAGQASSPKFRAPTLVPVFQGYAEALNIETDGFELVGSLASGGLTRAWGAGVATYTAGELQAFPEQARDLDYPSIARRVGVSGGGDDDIAPIYGAFAESQPPHQLGALGTKIGANYANFRERLLEAGFHMGRARLAVLTESKDGRGECTSLGNCLWGCARSAIYSARHDLDVLKRRPNVTYLGGLLVDSVRPTAGSWIVNFIERKTGKRGSISGSRVIIAAGTIASTKLALDLMGHSQPVRLQSAPSAGFALWFPKFGSGSEEQQAALAQYAYVFEDVSGFIFPTSGIPVAEFASRVPMIGPRLATAIMRRILPSMVVGNVFFNGSMSRHEITLRPGGALRIKGGFADTLDDRRSSVAERLKRVFRLLGGTALPGSFAMGLPGSDVHYACTLPMKENPQGLSTSATGEPAGYPGLHFVDGAVMPTLPAKSHTLTIMANADRIGRCIAHYVAQ